jgi:diguanylate cyclase (GGDEF)-like protein
MGLGEKTVSHKLPKLKSLLKKYRRARMMQSSLLLLSELASTVSSMESFYAALSPVIKSILTTNSFHIVLVDKTQKINLAHSHNPKEINLLNYFQENNWKDSLSAKVINDGTPLHLSVRQRKKLANKEAIDIPYSTCVDWLGMPLKRGQHVIGVIALQSYDRKLYFDQKDHQLLAFIAEYIVTAIDRVHSRELLEISIQHRTNKLTVTNQKLQAEIAERQKAEKLHKALFAISEITATANNIDDFYQALHQEVKTLVQADNFYIALLSDKTKHIEFPYFSDEQATKPETRLYSIGLTELAISIAQPICIANNQIIIYSQEAKNTIKPFISDDYIGIMPEAWLAAPLIDQGKVFGVLVIQHYQNSNAYSHSDLEIIRFVSEQISTAIVRKRNQAATEKNNDELEALVNERTKALMASNDKLRLQIGERRKAEAQLYHQAHHDTLTKLPNRAMFSERLAYAIRHFKRYPKNRFAVLFIDLDRFKVINDTLGHHAGDLFLIEISARLQRCVRDNDLLARLGGDEFVILLETLQSQDDVEEVTTRIINSVSAPFDIEGQTLYSNASIGIALSSRHYLSADEILRDADAAMYQAKVLGRGRYVFFDESMREQLIASMTLEQELRAAITEQQFELHYQKINNLESTDTIGFEVLLRWQHPSKGLLTPSQFLFMAEETGMIVAIEMWVLEQACLQLSLWQHHDEYAHTLIGINLSGRHLLQSNALNKLIKKIKSATNEPQRLILEFNESAFSQHTELALKGLSKLKQCGVKLALNDYGASFSSFNFLHNYPFEFIKLDRSFINSLNKNEKNLSLVEALNELGDKFGYRLVAEGIESEEMLVKLKAAGCEFGQGYHINYPSKMEQQEPQKPIVRLESA